jgi:hypothetical protein
MSELAESTVVYDDDSFEYTDVDFDASQSVALKDIPLDNWLTFIDKEELDGPWVNPMKIARDLGTNDRWVHRMIKEFGFESEVQKVDDTEIAMYPPYAVAIIKEEYAWRQHYRALPTPLSVGQIAEAIGRSRIWTLRTLEDLDARPARVYHRGDKTIRRYSKQVVKELRLINMSVPLDDGWYSITQLAEHSQLSKSRLLQILRDSSVSSQERRSSITGRVQEHFPPFAINVLIEERERVTTPGGDWLTAGTIGNILGKSKKWVLRNLSAYEDTAELRLADNTVPYLHFPPHILEELRRFSELEACAPEKGDYLTARAIASAIDLTPVWVEQCLQDLGIEPELRKDSIGRTYYSYSPDSISAILKSEIYKLEQQKRLRESMIPAVFICGSLYSQIKAKKSLLGTLRSYPPDEAKEQRDELRSELRILRRSFNSAKQRMIRKRTKYEESVPPKQPRIIVIE